jgi:hypothetical protein
MKRTPIAQLVFATASVAALVFASYASNGCAQGGEGDRCNPDLSNGNGGSSAQADCNGGLVCFQAAFCPENYCCPPPDSNGVSHSTNPNCQAGCNGGAASICNADPEADAACGFACANDPGDLTSTAACVVEDAGAPTDDAASDAPGSDGASDAPGSDAGPADAGEGGG